MNIRHAFSALSVLALMSATTAFAADAAAGGPMIEACKQDVQTLCPGVQPGEGRIKHCMAKNRAKLSDGCKAALREQRAKKKAAGQQ
ncbi:MAG: cysteine rich repeat-containing protein [Rhizobacter sp.]